jgi:hypothetical protein
MNLTRILIFFLALTLVSGCKTTRGLDEDQAEVRELLIPTWTFVAQATSTLVNGYEEVPIKAYVFPALRLRPDGRPIDQLVHAFADDGSILWRSSAPLGAELKVIVENALRDRGFRTISFGELTSGSKGHDVLVFNLYYTEAIRSSDNPEADPDSSWTTFFRVTGATYPEDLNPSGRLDVVYQELRSLFNDESKPIFNNSVLR